MHPPKSIQERKHFSICCNDGLLEITHKRNRAQAASLLPTDGCYRLKDALDSISIEIKDGVFIDVARNLHGRDILIVRYEKKDSSTRH